MAFTAPIMFDNNGYSQILFNENGRFRFIQNPSFFTKLYYWEFDDHQIYVKLYWWDA
jgi:hypothetical protein